MKCYMAPLIYEINSAKIGEVRLSGMFESLLMTILPDRLAGAFVLLSLMH